MGRQCYAVDLGDCAGPLSREHWISKGILELATNDDGFVQLNHGPTLDNPQPPKVVNAPKILCEHHNSALSPVDAEAIRLASAMQSFNRGVLDEQRHSFDGKLIVRWQFKNLLGFLAQNGAENGPGGAAQRVQRLRWLFGLAPLPPDVCFGVPLKLEVPQQIIDAAGGVPAFVVQSKVSPAGYPLGQETLFYPLRLVFLLNPPSMSADLRFKPASIRFESRAHDRALELTFSWGGDWKGGDMVIRLD